MKLHIQFLEWNIPNNPSHILRHSKHSTEHKLEYTIFLLSVQSIFMPGTYRTFTAEVKNTADNTVYWQRKFSWDFAQAKKWFDPDPPLQLHYAVHPTAQTLRVRVFCRNAKKFANVAKAEVLVTHESGKVVARSMGEVSVPTKLDPTDFHAGIWAGRRILAQLYKNLGFELVSIDGRSSNIKNGLLANAANLNMYPLVELAL